MKVADAVREKLSAPAREQVDEAPSPSSRTPTAPRARQAPPAPARKRRRGGWFGVFMAVLLMAPGIAASWVVASIWLVNRIGPSPGTLDDLRRGVDQFGMRYGAPAGATEWVFAAAIALTLVVVPPSWRASSAALSVSTRLLSRRLWVRRLRLPHPRRPWAERRQRGLCSYLTPAPIKGWWCR